MKIRTISSNDKKGTAMIVLVQPDPNNKGRDMSETRHLKGKGDFWTDNDGNVFTRNGASFTLRGE